jgi:predicted nucleotidyltransferase
MARHLPLADLREAARPILERGGVGLAVLFGSTARGRETAASDIDIGVAMVGGSPTLDVLLDLAVVLEAALGHEVDLVDLAGATPLLRREAAQGQCLYEREPGAFGAFAASALLEFDDVRPHILRGGFGLLRRLKAAS